jgi:acetyltransferase
MYASLATAEPPTHAAARHSWQLPGGQQAVVRPARPEDAALAERFLGGLSARTHRRRFAGRLPALGATAMTSTAALSNPQHVALVALLREGTQDRLVADARFVCDGDGRDAEFAIVVCDQMRRQGLGRALMLGLQQRAADRGVRWLRGEVQMDNPAMMALMLSLGYRPSRCDETAGLMVFEARLQTSGGEAEARRRA